MKKTYTKVLVNSKKDLPKETNAYFVSYRDVKIYIWDEKKVFIYRNDSTEDEAFWLEHVNWYLI